MLKARIPAVYSPWKHPAVEPTHSRMVLFVQNPGGWLCSRKIHNPPRVRSARVPRFCVTAFPTTYNPRPLHRPTPLSDTGIPAHEKGFGGRFETRGHRGDLAAAAACPNACRNSACPDV